MKRFAIAALLAPLALWACTTPTPYQPLASGTAVSGGYSDQALDDTHFRVSFRGNDMTSREQVETYLLYRAAELTSAKGFDWFEMVDRHTQNTGETYVEPYGPWGYWRPTWRFGRGGGWYGGWYGDPFWGPWGPDATIDTIDRYNASAEVVVGRGPKPANDPRAFDARQVRQNLAAKIVRPGETPPAHS
jgi:hypothetical protein